MGRAITLLEATINLHYSSVLAASINKIGHQPLRDALSDVVVDKKLSKLMYRLRSAADHHTAHIIPLQYRKKLSFFEELFRPNKSKFYMDSCYILVDTLDL